MLQGTVVKKRHKILLLTDRKDIHLDLKRYENGEVKPAYKINQRWVKNNRDPENVVYVTRLFSWYPG